MAVPLRRAFAVCLLVGAAAAPASALAPRNLLVLTSEAAQLSGLALFIDETAAALRSTLGSLNALHPMWIIGALILLGGQTALILGLLTRQRRKSDRLRGDQPFRLLADALPVGVWMADTERRFTYVNRAWLAFAGRPAEAELGAGWLERMHADDREAATSLSRAAFQARAPFSVEYRLRRHDGVYRWMLCHGTPRYDGAGAFRGFLGGCVDMTDRVEAERRQRELSGRLIRAQEDERRRIARELHDDIQQRLALVAIELDGIAIGRPPLAGAELAARARDLWRQTTEIATEVHNLSYRLHPSKLEALGLLATVQGYCRDLSKHGLTVTFAHHDVPDSIPADAALCVFRVVQESLQNVLKHSGVREAALTLAGGNGSLHLLVADAGRGFDPAARPGGLGLVSMRERLHLLGGEMSVRSSPGGGTSIDARVPLTEQATPPPSDEPAATTRGSPMSTFAAPGGGGANHVHGEWSPVVPTGEP